MLAKLTRGQNPAKEIHKQKLVEEAVEEFLRHGTPVKFINSLDISKKEKADIYDKACLRKKDRISKNTPYRSDL